MALWQIAQPLKAATFYWDTDGTDVGNATTGAGLGGTGTWDIITSNWWPVPAGALTTWGNTSADIAIFSAPFPTMGIPLASTVTLTSGITANQLRFERSGYTLTGGDLTLAGTTPTLHANLGESATINSLIQGSGGLTKTGGGAIRLGNNSNTYTGTTTISNGSLIITGQGALGTDTSAIVVTGFNPVIGSTNLRGFGGGSLVLDGTGGGFTISRDLSLQGQGPIADRGAALISTGNNTLSGTVDMGVAFSGTNQSTRMISADGTINITGTLNVLGTAATTISTLGGVNQAGASFYNVSGVLAGTGTLEGSGGGTLFLDPTSSSGFSGTIRVSGSAASGQSVVRIDSANVLGTRTATGTSSVIDMNGGVLAVLMDSPSVLAGGSPANVYQRASSTMFADHTPNSNVSDQTVVFGQMAFEDNLTTTFNGRNGYGMTFSAAPVVGSTAGDNDSTFANNLQGGALLTFTGNFWSNANNAANRTMTISGNGNTLISGNIIASAAAFNHNLTKTGTGTLTLTGTGSTLDGNVNVNGGTVAIGDFRAITNNTSNINIGTGTTGATFAIVGNNATLANLTTSKVINLAGTTGGATILANQTGTSPGVVLNASFTATGAGIKTLTLGGANIGANTINGAIVNNSGTNTTALTKIDAGRWVLAGVNTYTGSTTISNGILQLRANAATSTILADTSAIVFNATNVFAGGTLEFVGQASTNNVETLGALTPTNGSGTVKLTPGSGGTASLVFASLGTVGGGGTVNIDAPTSSDTVSFTTTGITNNIANAGLYYNGADFAFVPGAGLALRAPIYGTDADFVTSATALTAARSNEITGSFATGAALAIDSLKINGSQTLTLGGNLTIRTAAGASASGGIIQTGGSGTITGAFSVGTNNSAALVVNVDGGGNSLTIESTIFGTGGFTKAGQGTLRLAGANTQTGTISINEGTVRLVTGGTLGGAAALSIRQDGILELNGITPTNNINAFNNNGIVRNTSATTDVTFTVGGANGTGTSNGIIEDGGAGMVSVVKIGSGGQSWLGLSTYTGTTTIGSTGIVSINNLQNGGSPSGIGASGSAAGNLIFNGSSATQAYGGLSYTGTTNDSTDRLFTFDGGVDGGVRIQSNGVNGATSSWTNTGALAFGPNATGNPQGLVLGGASTGDNRFFPVINDNGAAATSVYKADAGVWHLQSTNGYTGATTIRGGALYASDGTSLPTASNLVLDGGNFASTGALSRAIGTGAGQMQWTPHAAGGFSAGGSPLTVDFGAGNIWGSSPGFLGTGALLLNNSGVAKSDVDVISGFEITQGAASTFNATTTAGSATVNLTSGTTVGLAIGQTITGNPNIPAGYTIATIVSATQFTLNSGTGVTAGTSVSTSTNAGGYRQVNVGDFTSIGADFATLSGVITGAGSMAKEGAGILNLRAANTYTGQTLVRAGTLVVETLGNSASPGATSVGDSTLGNTAAGAVLLGNGGATGGILEYVGMGETSDRYIRLNSTTGSNQIHADGVGALILTNVANDMTAGVKTLFLRGVNAAGNMITSQLSDNGGALSVTVDGSAMWILTNGANSYTGSTTVSGGALGIGDNGALGTGTLVLNNGSVFAYGADRTLANAVSQSNNTTTGFLGEYSLTFGTMNSLASANNWGTNNNLAAGKTLTFGGVTANSITANRTWTIDGSGETIINGNITTSTAFGVVLTKTGDGVLQLNGIASNYNQANANTDIDRGTLRMGANNVIPSAVGYGGVTLSPELANGDTATFDLNGTSQTINALTATTDGTAIIDNTSASAASLTVGANDSTVNFGSGTGAYTITDSGAGALSIFKTGNTAATIPNGVTLTYQGATGVTGGSLTIASPVNGTTALSVTNSGSALSLTGGITAPAAITSVTAENGTTLNLLDGAGNKLSALTALQLGSSGGTNTTLNLNVGDLSIAGDELNTDLFTLLTGGTLSLFSGNKVTFNLTDAGLNASQTYELLNFVDGGFTSGPLSASDYLLGATPGGFSSITLTATDTSVYITTGTLITGDLFWRGLTDNTWNANVNNWSQDKAGTTPATTIPGQGTDVIFAYDGASGALTTTLEQNFKINSLTFEAGASTPASVTINPGVVSTNRLEVAPQMATDGVKITTGGPSSVIIGSQFKIGASQTWEVADAGSTLTFSGNLRGEGDVTKSGAGKVTVGAAADSTFNTGLTSDFTIGAGTLEITDAGALGSAANSNLANVIVNSTGAFYYNNATAGTVANPLTLGGGALSGGGANHTYSGAVNVSADSLINLADSNGAPTATARNITLSGVVSGSGNLTIDGNNAVSGGNQLAGTLTLNNAGDSWTGDLLFNRGTVTFAAAASPSFTANDVTFNSFGRLILQGVDGQTINRTGTLTYAAGAVGEFQVDNTTGAQTTDFVVNQNGSVTLGSGGTGASVRVALPDAFAKLNIAGGVTLGGNSSISVSNSAARLLTISSIINDGGSGYSLAINDDAGGWAQTNGIVRLTGLNTFSGNLTVDSGTLEFDTASTVAGSVPNSLGQGTAITMGVGAATLSFIGATNQLTDRPITTVTGAQTLSANGTGGATITYAGAISVGPTADGTQITLSGAAGSEGIISGGITETGDSADMTVSGATWTHQTGTSRVGDDITVTGASTIFNLNSGLFQVRDDFSVTAGATLNLNGAGVLSFNTATLSGDATLQVSSGGVINLGANDAVVITEFDRLFVGQNAGGATAVLNMNAFNLSTNRLILGERATDREGDINGTGTLTVLGGDIDLYEGAINANLASTGSSTFEKFGSDTVTLRGDNGGLASTGATIVNEGTLVLDYTASNTTKVRAASQLSMIGGNLVLNGNGGAATSQSVGSFTLGSGGSSRITLNPGAGQQLVLNLGALTRANGSQDGTLRLVLPAGVQSATHGFTTTTANGSHGLWGSSGFATVDDGTGVWFATNSGGNVVALVSTAKNDVTTWAAGDHITDETTGFTGTLQCVSINSLRFDAAGGSDVSIAPTAALNIASGGILVTSNVGGTPSIMGGTLISGATELIITQDSMQTFEISSRIDTNHAITKSGAGTLLLSGNNTYTDETEIQEGTLQVSGGNAIGDTSPVTLATNLNSMLELLADETIGRLAGGQRNTNSDYGTVAVGTNTLTINNSGANTTYAGFFTGTGNIIRQGTHNLNLTNISSGFTGVVTVESGLFQLSGVGQINASIIRINKGGALLIDNNGTTRSGTRIPDTTAITMNSADGTFQGQTIVRGLTIRTDQDTTLDETVGLVTLNSGANYVGLEATTTNDDSDIIMNNLARLNNATLNVRGTNLGGTAAQRNELRIGDATNQTAFVSTLVGGGGAAGTQNVSIVPWAIGQTTSGSLSDTVMGNSLVTYVATGAGFRPLDFATEYDTFTSAAADDNVRESLTADLTGLSGKTVNSLVIDNNNTATVNVTGSGAGQTLINTSGAFLFTLSNGINSTAYNTVLSGFDDGIEIGGSEYVFHVVNPSSAATTPLLTATVSSRLDSAADITKSGRGTLIFTAVNAAGGGANRTTINEGTLEISDLDNIGGNTGGLVFAGGTLRLGATLTDDISLRTITFLDGGGTIDTNGVNFALANSLGSGVGGFTKAGLGNLTLNAAATYTGATTVSDGTLTIGANNAIGSGNLTVAGGATLDIGANSISVGLVTTSGASPLITGAGAITASTGFFLNHTGNTQIDAVLAGSVGLLKAQTNTVTLTAANTYNGSTEIQAGTLSINSIASVGAGASALGNPATAVSGIIRMGLTTAATTLNYTGSGHTSDRVIAMQGTTGGVTIDADGTGALVLGGAHGEIAGAKTLTLQGSSAASIINSIGLIEDCAAIIALAKSDANTWELTGTNTFTGNTTINAGVLRASNSQAFGAVGSVTLANTDAVLELNNGVNIANALTVGNSGNNKILRLLSGATAATYSGAITIAETTAGNFDVSADTAGTLTISGAIGQDAAGRTLNKEGLGTVVLSNTNTYSGATTINAGILEVTADGALGTAAAGTTVTGGAALRLNGVNYATAEALTINGTGVSGGGALANLGISAFAGAINVATNASIDAGGGTLTLSGGINKNGTTLTLTGGGAININTSGITGALANSDLIVDATTVNLNVASTYDGPTFIRNGGVLNANVLGAMPTAPRSATTLDDVGSGSSSLSLGADQSIASLSGAASSSVVLGSNTLSIGATTGVTSFAGVISGAGGLTKDGGASTQELSGANTYSGVTTINAGTLRISDETNLGINPGAFAAGQLTLDGGALNTTATMTIDDSNRGVTLGASGGTFETNAATTLTLSNVITGPGDLTKTGAGSLDLGGAVNTYSGRTIINQGTISLASETALGLNPGAPAANHLEINGGALSATASFAIDDSNRGITLGASGGTIEVGTAGDTLTVSNAVAGGGALTKTGAGSVVLGAVNSYAGATTVSAGTLQVGVLGLGTTGSGATTVDPGATLAGTGVIAGLAVTHTNNGAISPGDSLGASLGALSFEGDLLLGAASTTLLSIGDPSLTYDQVLSVNTALSSLTLDGIVSVSGFAGGYTPVNGDTWFLFQNWNSINAGAFNVGTDLILPNVTGYGLFWDTSLFTTNGSVSLAIPEPGRAMLLLLGLLGVLMRRRRG